MAQGTSFSVLTADIISFMLVVTLYASNRSRMRRDREHEYIKRMMAIIAISNFADCIVYYIDGDTSTVSTLLVFLSGSWLFLGNVSLGYTWSKFLMCHMNIPFTTVRKQLYQALWIVACILLIANLYYPVVFENSGGVYRRGPAYPLFLIAAFVYIADSIYLYVKRRKTIGTLKIFPIQVFLTPVIIGVVVQALNYEIAITWTSIAIGVAGIMASLGNELIYLDRLTGLYNRVYLEYLQSNYYDKKSEPIAGVMIDLNGFKQINDTYGHSEGDAALVLTADLLRKSFSEYGVVTRYAGDEFVVLLNTTDEQQIEYILERSKCIFANENAINDKPYALSASMGYAVSNLGQETIDEFMNRIDKQMYLDKQAYYKKNDRRKS